METVGIESFERNLPEVPEKDVAISAPTSDNRYSSWKGLDDYLIHSGYNGYQEFYDYMSDEGMTCDDNIYRDLILKKLKVLNPEEKWANIVLKYDQLVSTGLKFDRKELDSNVELKFLLFLRVTNALKISDLLYDDSDDTSEDVSAALNSRMLSLTGLTNSPYEDQIRLALIKLSHIQSDIPSLFVLKTAEYLFTLSEDPQLNQVLIKDAFKVLFAVNFQFNNYFQFFGSEPNELFKFQLLRVLETNCPRLFGRLVEKLGDTMIEFLQEWVNKDSFWLKILESDHCSNIIDDVILQSFKVLVLYIVQSLHSNQDVIIEKLGILTEKEEFIQLLNESVSISETSFTKLSFQNLFTYEAEFNSLKQPLSEHITKKSRLIRSLRTKNHQLKVNKQKKQTQFNDLLANYQQLNEEKMNNELLVERLNRENSSLTKEIQAKQDQLDVYLSNYDVIKTTNDRNKEMDLMNSGLKKDMEQITKKIQELQLKLRR
ncbi:BA75_04481T0 [Komagataella pastoris]|uniref:BA75_04481T0 n=1 Tax=Komagataella pastoris TaxID=4922 RepID=A0A1B2JJ24_PICPA|nr:BA75_04481T0 [Komagataella pastoris]